MLDDVAGRFPRPSSFDFLYYTILQSGLKILIFLSLRYIERGNSQLTQVLLHP